MSNDEKSAALKEKVKIYETSIKNLENEIIEKNETSVNNEKNQELTNHFEVSLI